MKKSRLLGAVCACAIGSVTSTVAWAIPVTITSNAVGEQVYDVSVDSDTTSTTAIPTTDILSASAGNSSSTSQLDYSGDAGSATFAYDFTHSINNTVGDKTTSDRAYSYNSSLYFTATMDTTYSIDGLYGMTGPGGTRIYSQVFLYDRTAGLTLFQDTTESRSTIDASFVLGVTGDGDFRNSTSGTLAGSLLAGHDYQFFFNSYIQALDANNQVSEVAAIASGDVNLYVGADLGPVPVPAAAWLFCSGLLGLVGVARRKKA